MTPFWLLIFASLSSNSGWSGDPVPAEKQAYDEIFDHDGRVRPHYRRFIHAYRQLPKNRLKKFRTVSTQEFMGDNALSPLPRVISREEQDLLRRGVTQRGRALQAFVQDHYSGEKTYLKAQLIPESVLQKILERNSELDRPWLGSAPASFFYGPDIIRDAEGQFRIVEDNTGYIGGRGDLLQARAALLKHFPEYQSALTPGPSPESWYEELARRYQQRAKELRGEVVIISFANSHAADREDLRLRKIYARMGINQVQVTADGKVIGESRVFVENDQLWLTRFPGDTRKRVKLAVLSLEPTSLDVRDFWKAAEKGAFEVINPPGMEFVNDKQFYVYVEAMIRHYLKETPILKNIETESFARSTQELISRFKRSPQDYVVKKVVGRGGDAVYLGSKMPRSEIPKLLKEVAANPEEYILQRFTPLSQMDGQIVDLRLYADFFGKDVVVSPVPWGRATLLSGDGKVNLSANGHETTVFVIDFAHYCREAMKYTPTGY